MPSENARELACFRISWVFGIESGLYRLIRDVRRHLVTGNDMDFPEVWCLNSDPYVYLAVRCKVWVVATGHSEFASPWRGDILQGQRLLRGSSVLARKSGPGLRTRSPVGEK